MLMKYVSVYGSYIAEVSRNIFSAFANKSCRIAPNIIAMFVGLRACNADDSWYVTKDPWYVKTR